MNMTVMLSALVGVLLAMIPPGCFLAGYALGRRRRRRRRRASAEPVTAEDEVQRKRLIEDHEAFLQQMTYGSEVAYQMGENPFKS